MLPHPPLKLLLPSMTSNPVSLDAILARTCRSCWSTSLGWSAGTTPLHH